MAQVFARAAAQRLRVSIPPSLPSQLSSSRGFAAGHVSSKVNMWEQPTNPGNWKEEQFVFASLGGWALIFYFGYRAATGGKKTEASPPIVEQAKEEAAQ